MLHDTWEQEGKAEELHVDIVKDIISNYIKMTMHIMLLLITIFCNDDSLQYCSSILFQWHITPHL